MCDWLLKQYSFLHFRILLVWDFPGGPVVQTLCVHRSGHGFLGKGSKLSRKLRSHMPCGLWLSLFVNKALLVPCLIHSLTFCQWLLWGPRAVVGNCHRDHAACKGKNMYYLASSEQAFPGGSAGKESACNAGDMGLIPGLGRCPGERKATHPSNLAWRIPWTV